MDRPKQFSKWKNQKLGSEDLSRKGSVDKPVVKLVEFINSLDQYFTTSSCSGRIVLFAEKNDCDIGPQKKGCEWLLVSHDPVQLSQLVNSIKETKKTVVMKFEAFVLHVQCRSLKDAQLVHEAAVASGHRNSGITVGNSGKIISAVRSTHGLEVPLTEKGTNFASPEYLEFLAKTANAKLVENLHRIERFESCLKELISSKKSQNGSDSCHKSMKSVKVNSKATQTGSDEANLSKIHHDFTEPEVGGFDWLEEVT
ncbi:tRNA wybutosine-synthesizing protein 3-like [Holothuria leucospilota]|uniref:tRNA wybutosine-synthesizing protein 3 homolog n=1 Tax=Holothuria leucospilota TaxID=206669 RepID=A0A9Q1C5F9_HOLLE|nr:tRNA wybutosine-synthesizing protein 3-like [Holothuria leucospilota]